MTTGNFSQTTMYMSALYKHEVIVFFIIMIRSEWKIPVRFTPIFSAVY